MEAAVADGGVPFFVGATSGSTVLGSFDPLVDLAKVSALAESSMLQPLCYHDLWSRPFLICTALCIHAVAALFYQS